MAENEADVAAAEESGYETSLVSRLALEPKKASACWVPDLYFDNEHEHICSIFFYVIIQ